VGWLNSEKKGGFSRLNSKKKMEKYWANIRWAEKFGFSRLNPNFQKKIVFSRLEHIFETFGVQPAELQILKKTPGILILW